MVISMWIFCSSCFATNNYITVSSSGSCSSGFINRTVHTINNKLTIKNFMPTVFTIYLRKTKNARPTSPFYQQ